MDAFANSPINDVRICEELGFSIKASWDAEKCKRAIRNEGVSRARLRRVLYRPFDLRWLSYHSDLLDTPSKPVCDAINAAPNPLVLLTPQIKTTADFGHILVSRTPAEKKAASHDRATQGLSLGALRKYIENVESILKQIDQEFDGTDVKYGLIRHGTFESLFGMLRDGEHFRQLRDRARVGKEHSAQDILQMAEEH